MRISGTMHRLYAPNTKVILELYDGDSSISAVTVIVFMVRDLLVQTGLSHQEHCRYSSKFILKAFPQNVIQNLDGPPVSSVSISLTDSCSLHQGLRVTFRERLRHSEAFLLPTYARMKRADILLTAGKYYGAALRILTVFFDSSSIEYVVQKKVLKSFVPK